MIDKKQLIQKSICTLGLALLVATQVTTMAVAKNKQPKLKSATGQISEVDSTTLILTISKSKTKKFHLNQETLFLKEDPIMESGVQAGDIVRIQGEGSKNSIAVKKMIVLHKAAFKPINSKKTTSAYGESKREVFVKGKITSLAPLQMVNYSGQQVSLALNDESVMVKEKATTIAEFQQMKKAQVSYIQKEDQLIAQKAILPYSSSKKQGKN